MIFFAAFTLGYFAGVFTALVVFPPRTTELAEQEKDALQPTLDISKDKELEHPALPSGRQAITSS